MPPGTRRPAPSNKTKRSYGYRLQMSVANVTHQTKPARSNPSAILLMRLRNDNYWANVESSYA